MAKFDAPKLRKSLKQEIARRAASKWDARALLYDQQQEVYDDKSSDIVYLGTRQLGKSWFAAVVLGDVGVQFPGVTVVFLDMDIEHAEKVILEDWQKLIDEHGLPAKIVDEVLVFNNGSKGYVFSGRANEIKKLQGMKPALLVVDEAQDAPDLAGIIKVVRPGLIRFAGRIIVMGVPGYVTGVGDWWDIAEGEKASAWSQHRGHMDRNPYLPVESREAQRLKALADLGGEESPEYQRFWLGLWPSLNNSLRVFRYFPEDNSYEDEAPDCKFYAIGLDPGGTLDAEGAIVVGHGNGDGNVWAVDEDETAKGEGGSWDETELRLGPMIDKWKPIDAFYDYGSAKKDGMKLILDADQRLSFKAVPAKDPDAEVKRINRLFAAKKLWVKKGSKLETTLKLTMWDARARAVGKAIMVKGKLKQNLGDALRAALWAVEGFAKPVGPALSDREARQARIRAELDARAQHQDQSEYQRLHSDDMF